MNQNLRFFKDDGLVKLSGALNIEAVLATRAAFWQEIENHFGVSREDPSSWKTAGLPLGGGERAQRLSGMNPIMRKLGENLHLKKIEQELQTNIDAIFGPGFFQPINIWYSLLSFPGSRQTWTLPHNSWHSDFPNVVGDDYPWSIFTFVFLDKVERNTGPTLAVSGSHRSGAVVAQETGISDPNTVKAFEDLNYDLVNDIENTKVLPVGKLLPSLVERAEWFQSLVEKEHTGDEIAKYMTEGTAIYSIPHKVQELTGSCGDVIVFDPRCLHTYSANVSTSPRQIIRLDFKRLRR